MMRPKPGVSTLALLLALAAAPAAAIDGAKPLVCDLAQAAQCEGDGNCSRVTPEQIDLPRVFRIDFEKRRITEPGSERNDVISVVEVLDDVVMLQGRQSNRGWTIVLDRTNGHLSAGLVDALGAFVLAGACTPD